MTRVAVVTGGASGFGLALGRRCVALGMDVVLLDLDADRAAAEAATLAAGDNDDDGIGVSVIFPSGMTSRHLETSEAAQPDHLRRPVAGDGDLEAMVASNPAMATALSTPDDAAAGVVEAVLAGAPYVVTHGDLTAAVAARTALLTTATTAAAEAAQHPEDG